MTPNDSSPIWSMIKAQLSKVIDHNVCLIPYINSASVRSMSIPVIPSHIRNSLYNGTVHSFNGFSNRAWCLLLGADTLTASKASSNCKLDPTPRLKLVNTFYVVRPKALYLALAEAFSVNFVHLVRSVHKFFIIISGRSGVNLRSAEGRLKLMVSQPINLLTGLITGRDKTLRLPEAVTDNFPRSQSDGEC